MADLDGARVLVFGATGNVGYGAAAACLEAGARVVAPTRTEQKATSLCEGLSNGALTVVVGDVSDPEGAVALAREVDAMGPIDHVFASIGDQRQLFLQPGDNYSYRRPVTQGAV